MALRALKKNGRIYSASALKGLLMTDKWHVPQLSCGASSDAHTWVTQRNNIRAGITYLLFTILTQWPTMVKLRFRSGHSFTHAKPAVNTSCSFAFNLSDLINCMKRSKDSFSTPLCGNRRRRRILYIYIYIY